MSNEYERFWMKVDITIDTGNRLSRASTGTKIVRFCDVERGIILGRKDDRCTEGTAQLGEFGNAVVTVGTRDVNDRHREQRVRVSLPTQRLEASLKIGKPPGSTHRDDDIDRRECAHDSFIAPWVHTPQLETIVLGHLSVDIDIDTQNTKIAGQLLLSVAVVTSEALCSTWLVSHLRQLLVCRLDVPPVVAFLDSWVADVLNIGLVTAKASDPVLLPIEECLALPDSIRLLREVPVRVRRPLSPDRALSVADGTPSGGAKAGGLAGPGTRYPLRRRHHPGSRQIRSARQTAHESTCRFLSYRPPQSLGGPSGVP